MIMVLNCDLNEDIDIQVEGELCQKLNGVYIKLLIKAIA